MELEGISRRTFKLTEKFMDDYKGKQPNWGPIGYTVYKRTYSRFLDETGTQTEEFWQTLQRVIEGTFNIQKFHCYKHNIPWDSTKAQKQAQRMFEKMWNFKFLPSGRGLWLMGTDFVYKHGSAGLNSCAFVSTEDIEQFPVAPFTWTMEALMLGLGTGFDVKGAGKLKIKQPKPDGIFVVKDSREGWVESLEVLLSSYFLGTPMSEFDYSQIRPAGEILKQFGGKAAGPQPLIDLHNNVHRILKGREGQLLTSVDICDIFTCIAQCVVAGNIRRSAMIALGDSQDTEFIDMKKGIGEEKKNRYSCNQSIVGTVGMDYRDVVARASKDGEPGIVWLGTIRDYGRLIDPPSDRDRRVCGVNPCSEQALESGEVCNLVETFPANHANLEEYLETLKYALLYGKIVGLLDTPWPKTNAVVRRNRRVGISQSGIQEAITKFGRNTMREWCERGYKALRDYDRGISDFLCVRESIKLTSVKPSGTISLLTNASPGIHYPHSEYYIRRVRFAKNSNLLAAIARAGHPIEDDVVSPDTTVVVSFPVRTENFSKSKDSVSVWQQLENAAMYQKYWADNQVSVTVTFKPEEADDLVEALSCYEDKLKVVSLLPLRDHGYAQAPYEEITKEKYEEMIKSISDIDYSTAQGEKAAGEMYCSNDTCTLS